MAIRVIVSDVGGVLIRFSVSAFNREMARVCGTTPEVVSALWGDGVTNDTIFRKFSHGHHTPDELRTALELQFEMTLDAVAFKDLWMTGLGEIYKDVYDLYAGLMAAYGVRVVSCTDVDPIYGEHIYRPGGPLYNFFDAEVRSYLIGAMKPDRAMYEAALRHAGVPAEECLFVDDVERNVEGAKAHGMRGVQCTGDNATVLRNHLAKHGLVLS